MDVETRQTLTANIQRLVRARGNISYVCDRIGINRQQFNKYLSGQHLPSQYNLNLICQFFGVGFTEIIDPAMHVPDRINPSEYLDGYRAFEKSEVVQALMKANDASRLAAYSGTYMKYHFSSIYKGSIVRAVTSIRPFEDVFAYANLERFPSRSGQARHDYVFKYEGIVFLIGDRLFMIDFECVQRNEITFSIYTPIIRNPTRFFFGVTGGIAANQYREPYMSRAVLDFVSRETPTRAVVRKATVVQPDDPSIPREALEYLKS